MRRGLRGLPIVFGMLWVAAAADAISLVRMDASPTLRSFLGVEGGSVGYPTVWLSTVGYPRAWLSSRGQMPNSQQFFDPGATHVPYRHDFFGRRTFIWHPNGAYDGLQPSGLFGALRPNLFLRRNLADLSWQNLRHLVWGLPHRYDPLLPGFVDRWGGGLGIGEPGALFRPLPGSPPRPSFGGRIEWRWDRFQFALDDFYDTSASVALGASASVALNTAAIPEPGTGVLLLAGLCALAARRRLR